MTVTDLVAELLPGMASDSADVTDAVLVRTPALLGRTTSAIVAELGNSRLPNEQVTVAVPLHVPWLVVADTKVTPAGSESVRTTEVAVVGPLLLTEMLYVRLAPATTGSGLGVMLTRTSLPQAHATVATRDGSQRHSRDRMLL